MHKSAIQANEILFNKDFVHAYDRRSCMQLLSSVSAKIILEYDGSDRHYNSDTRLPSTTGILFKPHMKYLDFACGTGMVTAKVYPYLSADSEVVGMDISDNALAEFRHKFAGKANVSAHLIDILDPEAPVDQFKDQFDLITCTISYHHLHNYRDVTKQLAGFLRPGGRLVILDFYNKDVERHDAPRGEAVQHMGGLALDALRDSLGAYANLGRVHCYPVATVDLWQTRHFLENHCSKEVLDKLEGGELEEREENGESVFLTAVDLVMAVGEHRTG